MATSPPTGVYYVYYQPGTTQLFLMLDQNSLPTVGLLSPGSESQQWQVRAEIDANSRTLRNVQFETYIGRSFAASQNGTLAVDSPVPWYMTSSSFGSGWWKLSANANDAGPWWVIEDNGSGTPTVQMDSTGWMIFFFLDASIMNNPSSGSIQPTSVSFGTSPTTSPSTPASGLSPGDVSALASSIPIGVLGLLLALISVWYARKQAQAGKPVLSALRDDISRVRDRAQSRNTDSQQAQNSAKSILQDEQESC